MRDFSWKNFLQAWFFPDFCQHCQKTGPILCSSCYQLVEFFWQEDALWQIKNNFKAIYVDHLHVLAKFKPPLSNLIKALKYQNHSRAGRFLGQMLFFHLNLDWNQYDLITYVPIHRHKKKIRGYNQAAIIAQELALWSNLKVLDVLERQKNTKAQAKVKNKAARLSRLEGVFQLKSKNENLIWAKKMLLIDDVITTGATANCAAKILKQAGASEITVITVASKF